jgi:hypothetical protein
LELPLNAAFGSGSATIPRVQHFRKIVRRRTRVRIGLVAGSPRTPEVPMQWGSRWTARPHRWLSRCAAGWSGGGASKSQHSLR